MFVLYVVNFLNLIKSDFPYYPGIIKKEKYKFGQNKIWRMANIFKFGGNIIWWTLKKRKF